MKYVIKSGMLSSAREGKVFAEIKGALWEQKRKVFLGDPGIYFEAYVHSLPASPSKISDVRFKTYIFNDNKGQIVMKAQPDYANDENPDIAGWPVCHAPRVDHANVVIGKIKYLLIMHNSQNYTLIDNRNNTLIQIIHRGISGGWLIEDCGNFTYEIICGLFIFCRYIEQENEFIIL